MNWDAVGAIGQILGSVAVFVTLGYLATQVRQAKRQMQRAATDNRAATVRQLTLTQLTNERLMGIFEKVTPRGPEFDALAEHVGLAYEEDLVYLADRLVPVSSGDHFLHRRFAAGGTSEF
jgi:hypothetical protein